MIHALTVVLAKDIRTDDVESLTNAIRMLKGVLKGVLTVETHVTSLETFSAQERARAEIRDQISEILWPKR